MKTHQDSMEWIRIQVEQLGMIRELQGTRNAQFKRSKEDLLCGNVDHTVDGRNPAPPGMYKTL